MLPPEKLKGAFDKGEDELWMLRAFLKNEDPEEVDRIVHSLHRELFDSFDCRTCANCCKNISPAVNDEDIKRISAKLEMPVDEFRTKYLAKEKEGFLFNRTPCPFLSNGSCSIYEARPKACREYPYTLKRKIVTRLYNLIVSCEVCPVVFEIFNRLKDKYAEGFAEYKREYSWLWREL